jgi:hypothetical protein
MGAPDWPCNGHACKRVAVRTVRLVLTLHETLAAFMRVCDSPACELSARASLANRIEVRDGV